MSSKHLGSDPSMACSHKKPPYHVKFSLVCITFILPLDSINEEGTHHTTFSFLNKEANVWVKLIVIGDQRVIYLLKRKELPCEKGTYSRRVRGRCIKQGPSLEEPLDDDEATMLTDGLIIDNELRKDDVATGTMKIDFKDDNNEDLPRVSRELPPATIFAKYSTLTPLETHTMDPHRVLRDTSILQMSL
ncbi:hypothetical protein HAX54_012549 [Datura stramonium]|uniref:Uncharacterized protein n=1 Tax=Datura stramonium TaxID=4076 RepID=A0ABS8TLV0_DATST|nr:hypothetical protein [Datura stramonium]